MYLILVAVKTIGHGNEASDFCLAYFLQIEQIQIING